jgi:RecA-family ATPase
VSLASHAFGGRHHKRGDGFVAGEARAHSDRRASLPVLHIVNAASFAGAQPPTRDWHVQGLIPAREITLLSGDGGTGKSLLALQLAVASAAGTDWVGTFPSQGPVLFVSAEDDLEELHRRLATIVRAKALELVTLDNLEILPLAGWDAVLAAPQRRDGPLSETPLFKAIRAETEARRPNLLILDTLADLFGGDEIKRPHARQFISLLRGLAIEFSLTIVLLSHPSLSGMTSGAGTSGSTAWSNSVRLRLYLERPKASGGDGRDDDVRILTTKKANYGRAGDERVLRWRDGVFVLHGTGRADDLKANAEDEAAFLEILADFARSRRHVSDKKSNAFAPAQFSQHPRAKGLSPGCLNSAMQRLFAARRIHNETSGPPSKQRERIVAGPPPTPSQNVEIN